MNFWYLIFIIFFFIFKIESGKIQPNFDEIFGNGWDKKETEEKLVKIEQNDQNEFALIDQIYGENGIGPIDQQKREIIIKFDAIKEKLREKGKYQRKYQSKTEIKIAKLLGTNRRLIHKWKNELNLNKRKIKKRIYEQKKRKFIERFDDFKSFYAQGKQKEFVKELGIGKDIFIKWKNELIPNYHKIRHNEEKLKKITQYFDIKNGNPKIGDKIIAKQLGISTTTLHRWKKDIALNDV